MKWHVFVQQNNSEQWGYFTVMTDGPYIAAAQQAAEQVADTNWHKWRSLMLIQDGVAHCGMRTSGIRWQVGR